MSQSINPITIVPNMQNDFSNTDVEHNLEDLKENEQVIEEEEVVEKEPAPPVVILEKSEPKIEFWSKNPNVLVQSHYIYEFFPVETMSFEQKLNALTRSLIIISLIFFIVTKKTHILILFAVSIICIFFMHYAYESKSLGEGFEGDHYVKLYDRKGPKVEVEGDYDTTFQEATPINPLANVLLTDYDYNTNKKPAQPSYTPKSRQEISAETKEQIQLLNPCQPNIDEKLFSNAQDNYQFEQSLRQFYSTANTMIPNDQKSFAEFCYGDIISGKEGNMLALSRDNPRYNLY